MATINPEFVERYQLELEKNPASRVFAPLAEAYRQMGLVEEALRICSQGVNRHPDFAGGRVAYARILIDRQEFEKALTQLEKAAQLSPDNLLAHSLLGDVLIELRRPKDALKAFKMVLFLNPADDKALKAVRKWEFLSADEYEDEVFKMKPVFKGNVTGAANEAPLLEPVAIPDRGVAIPAPLPPWRAREVERAISLADAFTVRGDLEKAINCLRDAAEELGLVPDLERRLTLLTKQAQKSGLIIPPMTLAPVAAQDQVRELELPPQLASEELSTETDTDLVADSMVGSVAGSMTNASMEQRREKLQELLRRIHVRRA